jgi:hypothetical protein
MIPFFLNLMSFKFTIYAYAGQPAPYVIVNNFSGFINTFSTGVQQSDAGISCGLQARL